MYYNLVIAKLQDILPALTHQSRQGLLRCHRGGAEGAKERGGRQRARRVEAGPRHGVDVSPLGLPSDVVGLARARHDRPAEAWSSTADVEPVADVLPLAVDRRTPTFPASNMLRIMRG